MNESEKNLDFIKVPYGEDSIFVLAYLYHCDKVNSVALTNYCYTHENVQSLSSTRQDGHKMMTAVSQDFALFRNLCVRIGDLPRTYIEYYRDYKALMFYNAMHNELLSEEPLAKKVVYFRSIPKEMSFFFKQSEKLPKAYKTIQSLFGVFPVAFVSVVYPWIYMVRQWKKE